MSETQFSTPAPIVETVAPAVSEALSSMLERTHEAVGEVVDIESVRAEEVGRKALMRAANVLRWFRSGVTETEVAEYAAIIDAMAAGRRRLSEAANDESFREAA